MPALPSQITSQARNQAALHAEGAYATLINDGTINLGTAGGTNGQHLVAMQSDWTARINNRRSGVVNIHADNSFAFKIGPGSGRLVNNGVVNIYGTGSGLHADASTAAADCPGADLGRQAPRGVSGYTAGTNADGSAGWLVLHQGGRLEDVQVDTTFPRGTTASQVRLEGVFGGAEGREENVRSSSVVWQARAERDHTGEVDVVITLNRYRALADAPLHSVASALEAGYANNALFHSLEVASAEEFNRALQQLSGSEVSSAGLRLAANGDAFWSSLARSVPAEGHRVMAFGPGTEAALGVRGAGTGMQVMLPMGGGRQLQLISGLLGSDFSSDGGQTRSQSRFAGVGMGQTLGAFTLQHSLGNEWHQLDGQRSLNWSGTQLESHSRRGLSRTRIGSSLSRDIYTGGVHWQPRIGANAYHSRETGFQEYGAHALGLSVGSGTRHGAHWELGTEMRARLGAYWSLRGDASVLGALASKSSERLAQLQGAGSQAFTLPEAGEGGLGYRVLMAADYRHARVNISAAVLAQRQFGATETQANLHLGYQF